MKSVIKEYASAIVGLIGTVLILAVLGAVLFQKSGSFAYFIQKTLEGGI